MQPCLPIRTRWLVLLPPEALKHTAPAALLKNLKSLAVSWLYQVPACNEYGVRASAITVCFGLLIFFMCIILINLADSVSLGGYEAGSVFGSLIWGLMWLYWNKAGLLDCAHFPPQWCHVLQGNHACGSILHVTKHRDGGAHTHTNVLQLGENQVIKIKSSLVEK